MDSSSLEIIIAFLPPLPAFVILYKNTVTKSHADVDPGKSPAAASDLARPGAHVDFPNGFHGLYRARPGIAGRRLADGGADRGPGPAGRDRRAATRAAGAGETYYRREAHRLAGAAALAVR